MQDHSTEQMTGGFLPHGFCYLWKPELLWLHVVTDLLIGLAYVAISFTLIRMVWKNRNEFPFQYVFVAFSLFIVACGLTHFVEVYTLWKPAYWFSGGLKAVTALASVGTAALIPPLVPRILHTIRESKLSEERREKAVIAEARMESLAAEALLGRARLEAVLQALPVGVFITDSAGTLVTINPAAQDIWAGGPLQVGMTDRGGTARGDCLTGLQCSQTNGLWLGRWHQA